MKNYLLSILLIGILGTVSAQTIPSLPIPIGAGTAEVWNNEIYHFGGSNNWAGSILYPRIYKFDGFTWSHFDSIPDNNVWDVESVLVGDWAYLISGWPSGSSFLRMYHLPTGAWEYLASSPNTQTWGVTAEYFNGVIYLFNSTGNVYAYNIATGIWSTGTPNTATGTWDLSSILYQDEIYIIGFNDTTFYKYTPVSDQWTQLENSPYQVGACAMGIINDSIYCVGGNNNGGSAAFYRSVIAYDIPTNTWAIDSLVIRGKRHWMATAEYKGGLYVVGGIDSTSGAVDVVKEIVPQGTAVGVESVNPVPNSCFPSQNYPNPFNPITTITYQLPATSDVELIIYNLLGKKIRTLVLERQPAGGYHIQWNGKNEAGWQVPSGVYMYRLKAGSVIHTHKMILLR